MKLYPILIIIIIFLLYFPALVIYFKSKRRRLPVLFLAGNWLIPTLFLGAFILLFYKTTHAPETNFIFTEWYLWAIFTFIFPANLYVIFYLIDKLIGLIRKKRTRFFRYIGWTLALSIFILMIWGMSTRYKLSVKHVEIVSNELPKAFDGFKIAQISDIHIGSLDRADKYLSRVRDSVNNAHPDMIANTGDLVNNFASEGKGYAKYFQEMKAPYGKFAVMGNHDYGDYSHWKSPILKEENLNEIEDLYRKFGYVLLQDEHVYLTKDSAKIGIIGAQYCGPKPFHCYSNFPQAIDTVSTTFNILLYHDPSQWRKEVLSHKNIQLMLAGHTHAAQLGIETKHFKFSPSQWVFKEWDGLYQNQNQYLNVNRGIGFIGIPFRLGMTPQITIITLRSKN